MQVVAVRLAEMPELAVRSEAIRAEAVRAEVIQVVAVPAKAIQAEIRAGVQAPVMVGQPEAQRMQATADHSAEVVEGRLGWEVVVDQQAEVVAVHRMQAAAAVMRQIPIQAPLLLLLLHLLGAGAPMIRTTAEAMTPSSLRSTDRPYGMNRVAMSTTAFDASMPWSSGGGRTTSKVTRGRSTAWARSSGTIWIFSSCP